MPALFLFNRRTIFGGDDLQPAAFITVSLRIFQLVVLLGPIFHHITQDSKKLGGLIEYMLFDPVDEPSCRHSHYFALLFVVHAFASAVYSLLTIALEWRIAHWSSQGSPTDYKVRSEHVSLLLEYKLVPFSILLFLVWTAGVASVSFGPLYYSCVDRMENNSNYSDDLYDGNTENNSLKRRFWWIALGLLLVTQIMEVLFSWVYLLHLCRQPKRSAPVDTNNHELVEEMWADRCASACHCMSVASCFLFGGRELTGQAEFGEVARALADYLETRGVLDVVPSDIVTGMIVLQMIQRQRLAIARSALLEQDRRSSSDLPNIEDGRYTADRSDAFIPASNSLVDREVTANSGSNDPLGGPFGPVFQQESGETYQRQQRLLLNRESFHDLERLEEGARYAKYALAIYTWVLYVYVHPATGPTRLLAHGGCACCCGGRRYVSSGIGAVPDRVTGRIEGDNMCETHKTALLLTAGLTDADLVYAQLQSSFTENPYCILLDHEWKSVVVSIRGTFSLEDCVTDVLVEPESLEQLGEEFNFDATGEFVHGGVLATVRNVYRDLQRHNLLEKLLSGEQALYPGYTLRLVGHSLGAATCTLLSYMLRQRYPTLRCINYSPPGCSLTWQLATRCKDWCTTFVLDSDLVPRLSLDSMDRLRDEILELLRRIKVSKIEVARRAVDSCGGALYHFFCKKTLPENAHLKQDMSEILYRPDEVPESLYGSQLSQYRTIQRERREARGTVRSTKLYPPGAMIHLTKTGEKRSCLHGIVKCMTCCTTSFGFQYCPAWIGNAELDEILVVPTMGTDHFPHRICSVLESVAEDFGLQASDRYGL